MTNCFAYGTLMHPEVIFRLLGRVPLGMAAELPNYRAVQLRGEVFPGLIAESHALTPGTLYTGLSPQDWQILDQFEGDWYLKVPLTVSLAICIEGAESPANQQAFGYLLSPDKYSIATNITWDFSHFCQRQAAMFLQQNF
jgi:hypothetical protein